jgi:hydrophobic/amphiphilic exporter-1 (mainly G- bacteria), HAE1 family
VSFTLTPMLAARWIKRPEPTDPGIAREHGTDASRRGFYRHIDGTYTWLLKWSMAHRWAVVTVCALVIASMVPLYQMSGVNFTPDEDESRFQISARLPVGSSLAATQSLLVADRARRARAAPRRDRHARDLGLRRDGRRAERRHDLRAAAPHPRARRLAAGAGRARAAAHRAVPPVGAHLGAGGRRHPGAERPRRADPVRARRARPPPARRVHPARRCNCWTRSRRSWTSDRSYLPGRPELRLDIDRRRAADLGIRVQDVSQTVNALVAGQDVTTFAAASDQYEVVLKAQDSFRRTPDSLASATVRTAGGALVPLRTIVNFVEGTGPASIDRLNRQRQITVSANPAPGFAQADAQRRSRRCSRASTWRPATTSSRAARRESWATRCTTS